MKRGPKGDPNPQKGPLEDPGTLKGTHCVTVVFSGLSHIRGFTLVLKDFFCNKKKQRKCITGSVLDVLLILKTLTFKSGIKGLKSYRTIRT